jgi:hypothetical protein
MNELYHEKQSLALCALHAVNNILQTKAYIKQDFDEIADQWDSKWSLWGNHRSVLGHYDINVIETALMQKGMETKWFDMRKGVENICDLEFDALLINSKSAWGFVPLVKTAHWSVCVSKKNVFWFLDSKSGVPGGPYTKQELTNSKELNSKDITQILLVSRTN